MASTSPRSTVLLDQKTWDLCLDVNGDIAVAKPPYALAQDAATAVRLFKGEAYYDTVIGIPYWENVLGKRPPLSLLRSWMAGAALRVPGVASARVFYTSFSDRNLSGQVHVTDASGQTSVASF